MGLGLGSGSGSGVGLEVERVPEAEANEVDGAAGGEPDEAEEPKVVLPPHLVRARVRVRVRVRGRGRAGARG